MESALRFAPEGDRVAAWDAGLDAEQAARLQRLEAVVPWISLHDHPIRLPDPMTPDVWARYTAAGRERLGIEGMRRGNLRAVFYSMLGSDDPGAVLRWAALTRALAAQNQDIFVAEDAGALARAEGSERLGIKGMRRGNLRAVFYSMLGSDDPGAVLRWAALTRAEAAHNPAIFVAEDAGALRRAEASGAIALFLSLESATPIGEAVDNVDLLFGAGVRSMGLTYNTRNTLGDGLLSPEDGGLTAFGREAVARMNALGVLVDLGHVGDRTSLDACAATTRPLVISHAGARAIWPSPRMKPDEVIRACADTGGVIGIEAAPHTTITLEHRSHDIDAVMGHVAYCLELVGEDHVALGPDTFFGDHRGLHELHPIELPSPEHPIVPYVHGFENPGECHRNAAAWMIRHGYGDAVIEKVLGRNVARVVAASLPAAPGAAR